MKEREFRSIRLSIDFPLSTSTLSLSLKKNRNTAAGLFVGVAAGAGAGYLLFGGDRSGSGDVKNDPSAAAARRRRRLLSLPLAPGAASSSHPALVHGCPPADLLREFPGFAVGWDARLRVPRWVAERITREGSRGGGNRSAHVFREDDGGSGSGGGGRSRGSNKRSNTTTAAVAASENSNNDESNDSDDPGIDPRWRSTNDHYLASGYDRGHCAPAADFKGDPRALEATFVLSNIAPQVGPGMNRDYWARFERFVKTLATTTGTGGAGGSGGGESETEVVVFTGPLYLPQRVKPDRNAPPNAPRYEMRHPMLGDPPRLVAVPTHFFKVALVLEKKKRRNGNGTTGSGGGSESGGGGGKAKAIGAWVMPNATIPPETPLSAFCVPLSALEDAAGGRFFQGVLDEEVVGSSTSVSASERLDRAALRWQARGRAAALESSGKNRKSVSAAAEAAAALLPLAPKLAGLLRSGGGGSGGKDKEEEEEKDGGGSGDDDNQNAADENDDSKHSGPSASPRASTSHAADLLLSPPPSRREQRAGRGGGGRNSGSGSSRVPPPERAPRWSWLFRNAAAGGGKGTIAHICDVTECKLPAEDWYKSGGFPAGGGGDKGAPKK